QLCQAKSPSQPSIVSFPSVNHLYHTSTSYSAQPTLDLSIMPHSVAFLSALTRPSLPASPFFFSSRRRHTRFSRDWSSDVCSSDLAAGGVVVGQRQQRVEFGEVAGHGAARHRVIEHGQAVDAAGDAVVADRLQR